MSRVLYLHVGYPKTATGFLQRVVLPQTDNLAHYVKPTITFGSAEMRFGDLFIFPPDLWESSGGEPFAFLGDDTSGEQNVLVSSEYIVGGVACPQPWMSDWEGEYGLIARGNRQTGVRPDHTSFGNHIGALARAARRQGFSHTRVLLTIRRQDKRLASAYAQASNRVRGASQENFERWAYHLTNDKAGFHFGGGQKQDYFRWWKTLTEVLGEPNVLFLPFELLRESRSEFLRRWLGFIEVEGADSIARSLSDSEEENRRSTTGSKWSIRAPIRTGPDLRPARIFRALGLPKSLPARWPDFHRGEEIQLTGELSEAILRTYEEGNRLLDEKDLDLSLKEYGYY